ncbi:MAG: IclR family transcriptional regulator [Pseudomonadota bacterium]
MATSSILAKSAAVLDVICASSQPLSFTQIGQAAGLGKSSTHRILSVLLAERMVALDARGRAYQPGPRLLGWAADSFRTNDLPGLAEAAMEDLCTRTGAHVALSILEGHSVLYLKTVDRLAPYRLAPRVGERSPVHACAAGKALLAFQRPLGLEAILSEIELERFTEHTIVNSKAMRADLERTRARGFALCDREEFLKVAGLSAPILGYDGEVVAALSLWNVVERQDIEQLLDRSEDLLATTGGLSRRLGFEGAAKP